jgi:hypothetical protein
VRRYSGFQGVTSKCAGMVFLRRLWVFDAHQNYLTFAHLICPTLSFSYPG